MNRFKNIGHQSMHIFAYFCIISCLWFCEINLEVTTTNPNIYINELQSNVSKGDTLTTDSVFITWFCDTEYEPFCEFRYQLNFGDFTHWDNGLRFFTAHLDDSNYFCRIQGRFSHSNTQSEQEVHFFIQALQSPALYLYPRQQSLIADSGRVILKTKDLPPCYGMEITFSTEDSIHGYQIFGSNDPNVLFDFSQTAAYCTVLPGGTPMSGDCDIMSISIVGITRDSSHITIDNVALWDSVNGTISLAMTRGSLLIKMK